ncbi:MAG: efflux RND transporter periplasmic adaptor subunit [Acidobacteria bacterium]|nr:efflux RND transporter periplasmic adaptor subunit [Acidobacteriota bacterium]
MKRTFLASAALVVVLLVVAVVIYAIRARGGGVPFVHGGEAVPAAAEAAPGTTMTTSSGQAMPRGVVVIDARRQQLIGVSTAPVTRAPMEQTLRTVGVIRYDERKLADVNLRLEGWIRDLYVDYTGQSIQQGQPLFTIYSPELLTTQQEYLLALKTRDQMQSSVLPDARERADQLVASARQRLTLWNLPEDEMRALDETRSAPEVVVFRSPVTGFVIEKQALQGMHVAPGQTLYKVANLSTVWIEADVYEREMATVRVGQRATVTLEAYPGESFDGRAIYIYPFMEESTRTVKVRLQFANPRGRLKPGMYANVELHGTGVMGLTVPANALIDTGAEQIVFVAQGDGYYTPRRVRVGRNLDDRIEILDGVKEGEQVATSATFFLDSESQLRAGLDNYDISKSAPAGGPTAAGPALDITFRTNPDPPKTGDSEFEVAVKGADGQPVADADVAVQMFMPAMPTMSMPAMRNETKLLHVGGGVYRGMGQVLMAGHWDVTVVVSRGGQQLGQKQLALAAR